MSMGADPITSGFMQGRDGDHCLKSSRSPIVWSEVFSTGQRCFQNRSDGLFVPLPLSVRVQVDAKSGEQIAEGTKL